MKSFHQFLIIEIGKGGRTKRKGRINFEKKILVGVFGHFKLNEKNIDQ